METNLEQSGVDLTADKPEEVPAESAKDSKILGKFASVEALAKAYEEIQSAFTNKSKELAELKDKAGAALKQEVKDVPQIAPVVIAGSGNGFAFLNVSEAVTMRAAQKVAENFFKEKR